jgi:hypothetical protein
MLIDIKFASGGFAIGIDSEEITEKKVMLDNNKKFDYPDSDE